MKVDESLILKVEEFCKDDADHEAADRVAAYRGAIEECNRHPDLESVTLARDAERELCMFLIRRRIAAGLMVPNDLVIRLAVRDTEDE